MANQVFIERTIFQAVDEKGNHLDASYGFRIYDDHASAYDNFVPSLEELNKLSSEDLIARAKDLGDAAYDMIEFAKMNGEPVIVDGKEVHIASAPAP
jgi:hypothetical protein